MLVGAHYFELFKTRLNGFKTTVIKREKKEAAAATEERGKEENEKNNWDKVKIKSCDTFSELINLDSQKRLLQYLIKMIDLWCKLLDVKERLNTDLIARLEVFEILKSSYFIFSFYGATKYTKLACTLYVELVLLHGEKLKNHLIFAYYCQMRLYMDYGLLEKARSHLKTGNALIKNTPKAIAKFLVNEIYLFKVAQYELSLLTDEKVEQAATDLKALIKEEYFSSVTVISGYIRGLACSLLIKFSAKQCPNQDLPQYFNESFAFTKSLFGKWYPSLVELTPIDKPCERPSDKPNDKPNDKSNDKPNDKANDDQKDKPAEKPIVQPTEKAFDIITPIWLEFAVARFSLESSLTYYLYSINCSVFDLHFFFNILVTRLSRIYGSLLWYVLLASVLLPFYRSIY